MQIFKSLTLFFSALFFIVLCLPNNAWSMSRNKRAKSSSNLVSPKYEEARENIKKLKEKGITTYQLNKIFNNASRKNSLSSRPHNILTKLDATVRHTDENKTEEEFIQNMKSNLVPLVGCKSPIEDIRIDIFVATKKNSNGLPSPVIKYVCYLCADPKGLQKISEQRKKIENESNEIFQ